MGTATSKPMREVPARFVAKQLPRAEARPAEELFKKPEFSLQGINTRKDNVNTEPVMYVETEKDGNSTELTDHAAPKWYLNSWMEMVDNSREDRTIISGNLPASWERDKAEPYALVRGRIDDEDLDWLLGKTQRSLPVDELVGNCKLDRSTIEDILATVELPRTQYRNYQGKLHKSIDDSNTFLEHRKKQIETSRESEVLRQIGFTEEDVQKDEQYRTQRSRGAKMLDDLGVSIREKKRMNQAFEHSDMDRMLEQRRIEQLEAGEYELKEEDLERDTTVPLKSRWRGTLPTRSQTMKNMYRMDSGKETATEEKIEWWLNRSRRIKRGADKIYGVPVYNESLHANEEQMRSMLQEAASFGQETSKRQGSDGYMDPRGQYEEMMTLLRSRKDGASTTVSDDGASDHPIHKFPRKPKDSDK